MQNRLETHRFYHEEGQQLNDELFEAIQAENLETVDVMLSQLNQEEIDLINSGGDCDYYALYLVTIADKSDLDMLKLFQKKGINITREFPFLNQGNLLFEAGSGADSEFIGYLIEQGIDPNIKNTLGVTALWKKVERQDVSCISVLLKSGADIFGKMDFNSQLNRSLSMKEAIERLIPGIQFMNIGTENDPVYRMMDDFGKPFMTQQELKDKKFKIEFKNHNQTKIVTAFSIFNSFENGVALAQAFSAETNLAEYLNLNEIKNVSLVSAVRSVEAPVNSVFLAEAKQASFEKVQNSFKKS